MGRTTLVAAVLCAALAAVVVSAIPNAHIINNVPYHRQVTAYGCGDACFQMVMGYYGLDLNQLSIMDVLRTSISSGTLSLDVVRGAQFSYLSNAQGRQFPAQVPKGGWDHTRAPNLPGISAFGYRQMYCWLDELKATIAKNIPAIILMEFGDVPGDGHFRVLIGYNDTTREVTMLDPWDRNGYPRVARYSYEVFCGLWAHVEVNYNVTYFPNFAAVVIPWNISVELVKHRPDQYGVVATIDYVCPSPFCNASDPNPPFVANNVMASVSLPPRLQLAPGQTNITSIGRLVPGKVAKVQWEVLTRPAREGKLTVAAWGMISGSLPKVPMYNSTETFYPPYTYNDVIGAVGVY